MRRLIIVILCCTFLAACSGQKRGCVQYDKKTGQMKVSDKKKVKDRGLIPKNPKKAF